MDNFGGYVIPLKYLYSGGYTTEALRDIGIKKEETVSKEALEEALIRLGLEDTYTVYDPDDGEPWLDVAQFEADLLTTREKRKADESYKDATERLNGN